MLKDNILLENLFVLVEVVLIIPSVISLMEVSYTEVDSFLSIVLR